ncbi:Pet111p Ecym_2685 [Eremothecium cymbalariae DBVPG|uniref:Uncharacterized protein n=1 Tax=Eremothecium cymbalariae (strain CBS 270.75 / DBVPG 7215 / KCTC 17166 / NRRL Y-17582) TaxID=931890 RepID=G8JNX0_ERECY|nr:Hypothetical protein Ecym_2685 [Eremothecium cymbalariae DBVPG\
MWSRSRNLILTQTQRMWFRHNKSRIKVNLYGYIVRSYKIEKEQHSEEIRSWVKDTLQEPSTTRHVIGDAGLTSNELRRRTSNQNTISIVSDEEFESSWRQRFLYGELKAVQEVVILKKTKYTMFKPEQLIVLISALKDLERFYDIDRIYKAYHLDWSSLHTHMSAETYHTFLKLMIDTQSRVGNYPVVEVLFKQYIKYPDISPSFLAMGLKAMLENKNYITARQFFNYMTQNRDVFPINEHCLLIFLKFTIKNDDLWTLKEVFEMWLNKVDQVPSPKTISMVQLELQRGGFDKGIVYWNHLSRHPKLINGEHQKSYYCMVGQLILQLDAEKWPKEQVEKEIRKLLDLFKNNVSAKKYIYFRLMKWFASAGNFQMLKTCLALVHSDAEVQISNTHHQIVCSYFAKYGLLHDLTKYLKDVSVLPKENGLKFNRQLFSYIWMCSVQGYPMLKQEWENEFKLLYNDRWYSRTFPWLPVSVNNLLCSKNPDMTGDKTKAYRVAGNNSYKILSRVVEYLQRRKINKACSLIMGQVRLGIRPNFSFYYMLLRYCVNHGITRMIRFLCTKLRHTYKYIPIKIEILELRNDIYKSMSLKIRQNGDKAEAIKLAQQKILTFVQQRQQKLNFQNYLQLTLLCSRFSLTKLAPELLLNAKKLTNVTKKYELYLFYRTALMLYVRMREPEKFLHALKEFNENQYSTYITKYWISSTKRQIKLFETKNANKTTLIELYDQVDIMRINYAKVKIEGLEEMLKLITFMKTWLNNLVYEEQLHVYRKQKILEAAAAESASDHRHS